ncbi:uncharacterized protein MJAP1_002454 [Malassezia japonica]|uniref:Cytochrome b mRNA-processing protein 4 n=1 Tax=Malassezia japonica TaxID=223818 RepID=A0AAF0JA60_9BASI|nr:uncharacterized protein MJAP1_002454 [Malassezia japonica]WFD39477.1 hypothetical protein MJAP1_002454 [Malassezia japonica]
MAGGARNWTRAFVGGSIIIGIGYALLKYNTPSEQELYNSLSPDLKREVDQRRRQLADAKRSEVLKQQHKEIAAQQDTAKPNWSK